MNARQLIAKRDAFDADAKRKCREIRILLPTIGARYGLSDDAFRVALNSALSQPVHAHACLKAIERSLKP